MKSIATRILAGSVGVLSAGCSVVGIRNYELAHYDVVRREPPFEIRRYAAAIVAQTDVEADYDDATSVGFKRLADFIFGNNVPQGVGLEMGADAADRVGRKIAMTGPVVQESSGPLWRMTFHMPAKYSLDSLPAPADPSVAIRELPERTVAALRFSGDYSERQFWDNAERLQGWVAEQGLEPLSTPRLAGYDPPWTLPRFRRNEVLIEVR